ncbi:Aminopeptidase P2 [Glycine soja]
MPLQEVQSDFTRRSMSFVASRNASWIVHYFPELLEPETQFPLFEFNSKSKIFNLETRNPKPLTLVEKEPQLNRKPKPHILSTYVLVATKKPRMSISGLRLKNLRASRCWLLLVGVGSMLMERSALASTVTRISDARRRRGAKERIGSAHEGMGWVRWVVHECELMITYVPIQIKLVDLSLLSAAEIDWLNNYHSLVWEKVSPLLDGSARQWLWNNTLPIVHEKI